MGTIARTDVELVAASLRGEHDAFGHLVARYQDVVCAVSYSSTGDRNLSEDVAQETFIAAWSQLDRLRDQAAIRSWLCGMARNIARKARKRLRREELVEADERAAEGNPFDDAARGDAERIVREALSRIPDGCREVLVLYYREDLSVKEIAETLGTNEVAVMQRLSRGRRYLADGVTELVERSLRGERRRRDLVAAVLASIAAIAIPSRVDASPLKGSTMLKAALAVTAVAAVGGAIYLGTSATKKPSAPAKAAALHFGNGKLGLAHAPALGPTAAPRAIHSRSVAQSDLALLPADAEAVIGINLAQMRGSALWQNLIASHVANDPATERFKTLCGFDPLQSIDSVAIGVSGLGPAGPSALSGTIVIHGLPKARAMTCFDEHGIKASEEDGSKVTVDHDTVLIVANNQHFAFTFIDDSTALLVLGPAAATRDSVAQIAAGGGTLATAGKYVETLSYVNTDDSLWFMLAEGSPMITMINLGIAQYTPAKLGTVYAALNMTDSVAIDAGLRLQSPEAVAGLVQRFQDKLADPKIHDEVAQHFDQLDVAADGSDLIISLAISGDELANAIQQDVQVTTN